MKVLAKEVGDGFNITSLLNDSSGWLGRQQQITSLQNKVRTRAQLSFAVEDFETLTPLQSDSLYFPPTQHQSFFRNLPLYSFM